MSSIWFAICRHCRAVLVWLWKGCLTYCKSVCYWGGYMRPKLLPRRQVSRPGLPCALHGCCRLCLLGHCSICAWWLPPRLLTILSSFLVKNQRFGVCSLPPLTCCRSVVAVYSLVVVNCACPITWRRCSFVTSCHCRNWRLTESGISSICIEFSASCDVDFVRLHINTKRAHSNKLKTNSSSRITLLTAEVAYVTFVELSVSGDEPFVQYTILARRCQTATTCETQWRHYCYN